MATKAAKVGTIHVRSFPIVLKETKAKSIDPPDVCGLSKFYGSKLSKWRKCFWFFIYITCVSVCCWQVSVSIKRYLAYPLSTLIKLERLKMVYPPSITVCLHFMRFYTYVYAKAKLHQNKTVSSQEFEQFWKASGIEPYQTTLSVPCDIFAQRFGKPCNWTALSNIFANHTPLQTLTGQCVDINFKYKWKQRMSPIELYVEKKENFETMSSKYNYYNIFFHSPNLLYFNKLYDNTNLKYKTEGKIITFHLKQYMFQNSPSKPCQSEQDDIKCWQHCLIKKLEDEIGCNLPFMSLSNLSVCKTWNDAFKVIEKYEHFIETGESEECDCIRPCKVLEYAISTEVYDYHQHDFALLRIYIRDTFDEFIEEFYAYPLPSLIGDLSGVIGFFLGMTVATFVEIVEYIGLRLYS